MDLVRLLRALSVTAILFISCGSAGTSEQSPDTAPASTPPSSAAAAPSASSSVSPAASVAPVGSACPAAATPTINRTPPTPIAAFAGTNGASKPSALIESVDVAAGRLTVTFSNAGTGGVPSGAPPTLRATLRVTSASRMQDVVTSKVPLTAAVAGNTTRLAIGPGAPEMPAKAQVFVVSLDACQVVIASQVATIGQAAPAGAGEWVLAAPIGKAFPAGSFVVVSAFKSIQLADLRPGDLLVSGNPVAPFGLVFSGSTSDLVLTRLIRRCNDVPCPYPPE